MAFRDSTAVRKVYEDERQAIKTALDAAKARLAVSGEYLSLAEQAYEADEKRVRELRVQYEAIQRDIRREFGEE